MFQEEISRLEVNQQEDVMEIVTSWMRQGIEQGANREARSLVLRLLSRKLGELPQEVRSQIDVLSLTQLESLGEALLDFSSLLDLTNWLAQN
ncbi:DUF4351 domain-containing protein [Nostoc spongiaeforme]|uniref:DUF4351 domain-containing protein n=1 Tax=Nostoc spongiaeforme TaxID=502487 RepID=UPI0028BEBFAF|nr:DUF4351 domain-containing protein [Nostoc spongiaeforme]